VITALGDHERLPMIVGVVTTQEPLCLVTQFHGINGTSGTPHHAAISNIITSPECLDIFVEICYALKHVHSRGFLHNDIKVNNVVLERRAVVVFYRWRSLCRLPFFKCVGLIKEEFSVYCSRISNI